MFIYYFYNWLIAEILIFEVSEIIFASDFYRSQSRQEAYKFKAKKIIFSALTGRLTNSDSWNMILKGSLNWTESTSFPQW